MAYFERIGRTPLVEIESVFVKLECANPGGSVKDRIARFMLEAAMARGELARGDTVVEATSGNTGIALALAARELGCRAIIFMPEHMSVERARMIEHLGAEVRLTSREASFAGAVAERDAYRGRPRHFVPDQFGNPDNTRCHRETTGREIVASLRERGVAAVDAFVAGIGTGGTLMGVAEALRAVMPRVRVVAVEPEESKVMLGGPAGEHGIMGIGDGFIPDLVDMSAVDEVIAVDTAEAHAQAVRLRRQHGCCVGRSAGANFAAALRLVARGETVVTVAPDCSDRYVSVGLEPPSSPDVRCPMQAACAARGAVLLGV
jgi:cysteine synthase A